MFLGYFWGKIFLGKNVLGKNLLGGSCDWGNMTLGKKDLGKNLFGEKRFWEKRFGWGKTFGFFPKIIFPLRVFWPFSALCISGEMAKNGQKSAKNVKNSYSDVP